MSLYIYILVAIYIYISYDYDYDLYLPWSKIYLSKTCWLQDLRLLGLVASIDPDRDGVKDILENVGVVRRCHRENGGTPNNQPHILQI